MNFPVANIRKHGKVMLDAGVEKSLAFGKPAPVECSADGFARHNAPD